MALDECKLKHTYSQLTRWIDYLIQEELEELNRREKFEFYHAQTAAELRRIAAIITGGNPRKVEDETFLIKWKNAANQEPEREMTKEEITERSKMFWFATIGADIPVGGE